jgi:hypothetical protein
MSRLSKFSPRARGTSTGARVIDTRIEAVYAAFVMGAGVLFLAACVLAPAFSSPSPSPSPSSRSRQESATRTEDKTSPPDVSTEKKIVVDFSDEYEHLSEDLERNLRWKRLLGKFGIAEVHIYPARETGPYLGPPMRIWGNGWGTSMWRDPITGWPIQ